MAQVFTRTPEECNVAAVCGNVVKIYGKVNNGIRAYTGEKRVFTNYGQALEFASEYDDLQRTRSK